MQFIPNDRVNTIVNAINEGHTVCLIVKTNRFMSQAGYGLLSKSEQTRANKYFHAKDRDLSIVSHAIKRVIISKLTNTPALSLVFEKNALGKPSCTLENSTFFNISHSGKFAVVAFNLNKTIGVDIEFPRDNDYQSMADACLNEKELHEYKNTNYSKQYFITRWTQKEALTKMNGSGLNSDFNKLVICSTKIDNIYYSMSLGKKAFLQTIPIEQGFLSICQESEKKIHEIKLFNIS